MCKSNICNRKYGLCRLLLLVLLMVVMIVPVSVFAAEVEGLYQAEVQVFSQKRRERAAAMSTALVEVLVKVSGQRDAALQKGVVEAINRPAKFLQQYRYRALSAEQRERVLQAAAANGLIGGVRGDDPQIVHFRFDKVAVDKLLRSNDLPVWGATRPATLAWLAVQDEDQRYLLAADSVEPAGELLKQEAQRRGLALLLPLMDLEDQRKLSFADVWAGFQEPILNTSARYRTESILVGRMYRSIAGEWQAQWTLLEGAQVQSWAVAGMLPAEVIDEGIAGAVEVLASRYAPVVGEQAGLLPVTVMDVRDLGDYARVTRYLKSLQQVGRVRVVRVEADQVTFELGVEGGPRAIAQTIALGSVLQRYQPMNMGNGGLVSWAERNSQTYRLVP